MPEPSQWFVVANCTKCQAVIPYVAIRDADPSIDEPETPLEAPGILILLCPECESLDEYSISETYVGLYSPKDQTRGETFL